YATTNLDKTGWVALGASQTGTDGLITFFHTTTGDQKVFFKVEELSGSIPVPGIPSALTQVARLNLDGQNLSGLTLTNLDLNHYSMREVNLSGADLRNVNLSKDDLQDANLSGTKLNGTDFTDAAVSGIDLSGCTGFKEAKFSLTPYFRDNGYQQPAKINGVD